MKPVSLSAAIRLGHAEMCGACDGGAEQDAQALQHNVQLFVEKEHAETVRQYAAQMLAHEVDRELKRLHHAGRPAAAAITRSLQAVAGQRLLPTMDAAMREPYELPDGRIVVLGAMTLEELRLAIDIRTKLRDAQVVIIARLEYLEEQMVARGVTSVRELLAI